MTRRAVDFATEWMSQNLSTDAGAEALAQQLEIDAALVGISKADIEEDMGPLDELIRRAQVSLIRAGERRDA